MGIPALLKTKAVVQFSVQSWRFGARDLASEDLRADLRLDIDFK